ncbi:MAG: hypothetical protein ACLS8R_09390 [Anaeromassilibacillus sp.]
MTGGHWWIHNSHANRPRMHIFRCASKGKIYDEKICFKIRNRISMRKNCKPFGTPLPQETPGGVQMEEDIWPKEMKFVNLVEKLCKYVIMSPVDCNGGLTNK